MFSDLVSYSFVSVRWQDVGHVEDLNDSFIKFILIIFEQFNVLHYCLAPEVSDKGRPHFQGIIWRSLPFSTKEDTNFRNTFRRFFKKYEYFDQYRSKLSLAKAKKPHSLIRYVLKCFQGKGEKESLITNLTDEQLQSIPLWEDKAAHKARKWESFITSLNLAVQHTNTRCFETFDENCLKEYKCIFGTPPHNRSIYIKAALATDFISSLEYARMLGVNWNILNNDPFKYKEVERLRKDVIFWKGQTKSLLPQNQKLFSNPST